MAAKNPVRNYAIEYVGGKSTDVASIVSAAIAEATDPSGDVIEGPSDSGDSLPPIENLPTEETDTGKVLKPDGTGGVLWSAIGATGPFYMPLGYTDVEVQAAVDAAEAAGGGRVYCPGGDYLIAAAVVLALGVTLSGSGRRLATKFKANANSINLVSATGAAMVSTYETDELPPVYDIEFDNNGHTGVIGLAFIGGSYFAAVRCSFRGAFAVGLDYYGALQAPAYDCKFVGCVIGLQYEAASIGYFSPPDLPPSRVMIDTCAFYDCTKHAVKYSGGSQLIIDVTEMGNNGTVGDATSAAIWASFTGDVPGPGLTVRGEWHENNHGRAAVYITGTTAMWHRIEASWFAYTDATDSIVVDGSSAQQVLVIDQVHHDTVVSPSTVKTIFGIGDAVLFARHSTFTVGGSWTMVVQEPLGSGQAIYDWSQLLAVRLPNRTTTERDAIASPTSGLLIWNTTTSTVQRYTGAAWGDIGAAFATPTITLGAAAAAGAATTTIRSDATIAAFDATAPTSSAVGDAAATGSVAFAARRDHVHGREGFGTPVATGAANASGSASTISRSDHVHQGASSADHGHTVDEVHLSDGSTTTYTLDAAFEPGTVQAWNKTALAYLDVVEVAPDQATVSAAGSAGDKIAFSYATVAA